MSSESSSINPDDENTFRILVATDIHLGYMEKDPIRGDDSFRTFQEILETAASDKMNIDFVVLGGDLFHDTNPSVYCIRRCIDLLKKYCLGERAVQIEFLSNPSSVFRHNASQQVNYEDENLNVAIPVFSIHGNHDDPTGPTQTSAMDLMSSTGLINYFGRITDLSKIDVEPILLKKGESRLALYGLSHVKDEKLGRLFIDGKVTIMSAPDTDEWFQLLVWHQNRAVRGVKNFIPDDTLPSFLDLVIWGHEHDCRIIPELRENGVYICQPGSSVATSLAEGEAIKKQIGLLKINKKEFQMTPIELRTVRPFIFKDIDLDELDDSEEIGLQEEDAVKAVTAEVEKMIKEANEMERDIPMLPLIRLRVTFHDERQTFNAIRFGQKYLGKVANPEDMVKLRPPKRERMYRVKVGKEVGQRLADAIFDDVSRVEDLIIKRFQDGKNLDFLPPKGLTEAVIKFIDASDNDAPNYFVEYQTKLLMDKMLVDQPSIDDVEEYIEGYRANRETLDKDIEEAREILDSNNRSKTTRKSSDKDTDPELVSISDDDDDPMTSTTNTTATAKPARGRGSRGGKLPAAGRGRGRGKKT